MSGRGELIVKIIAVAIAILGLAWVIFTNGPMIEENAPLSETIRNIVFIVSGPIGLYFLWWRSKTADEQIQIGKDDQLFDQFQRGAAMLGAPQVTVRVAGVTTLSEISKDDRYINNIYNTMLTYICNIYPPIDQDQEFSENREKEFSIAIESFRKIRERHGGGKTIVFRKRSVNFAEIEFYISDLYFDNCRIFDYGIQLSLDKPIKFGQLFSNCEFVNSRFQGYKIRNEVFIAKGKGIYITGMALAKVFLGPEFDVNETIIVDDCDISRGDAGRYEDLRLVLSETLTERMEQVTVATPSEDKNKQCSCWFRSNRWPCWQDDNIRSGSVWAIESKLWNGKPYDYRPTRQELEQNRILPHDWLQREKTES